MVPEGYFEPQGGEQRLFRFGAGEDVDGHDTIRMSMNARYSHMSEEALRMAASYEYALHMADQGEVRLEGADTVLSALTLSWQSLRTDVGNRDRDVWKEFLTAPTWSVPRPMAMHRRPPLMRVRDRRICSSP